MQTEDILGAAFHPLDDNLMITYGKGHLTFWTRRKDGFFEKIDIVKAVNVHDSISPKVERVARDNDETTARF